MSICIYLRRHTKKVLSFYIRILLFNEDTYMHRESISEKYVLFIFISTKVFYDEIFKSKLKKL